MPEIRNGNAAVEFIRREAGGWVFRWTAFPDELRPVDGRGAIYEEGDGIKLRDWLIVSQGWPSIGDHLSEKILFCPGDEPDSDDAIDLWRHPKSLLNELVGAINKYLHKPSWGRLRARVRAYQETYCSEGTL